MTFERVDLSADVTLYRGDCLEVLPTLEAGSVDSIVTDPPYGLSFMGKDWDYGVPGVAFWTAALRVAKPGAHLLAFGGTRTHHRLMVAIEDAGWEIRDTVMWVYGSGFPKSHDASKAIDKAAGVEFDAVPAGGVGFMNPEGAGGYNVTKHQLVLKGESTDAARQWAGWGTALKPAWEPIIVARKSLDGTVAENVLAWGTGAINVDGCRVGTETTTTYGKRNGTGNSLEWSKTTSPDGWQGSTSTGRWPANVIHDGSDEVVGLLNDAARFFYCAKASKRDRDEGCEGLEAREAQSTGWSGDGMPLRQDGTERKMPLRNHHPTVKPTDLMRYLCRLVTPPGGVVLDPFMGSGSTGKAAVLEGFDFIGVELDAEYLEIARARIAWAEAQPRQERMLP